MKMATRGQGRSRLTGPIRWSWSHLEGPCLLGASPLPPRGPVFPAVDFRVKERRRLAVGGEGVQCTVALGGGERPRGLVA